VLPPPPLTAKLFCYNVFNEMGYFMSSNVIAFSTKDILVHFMNLLNPQVFKTLEGDVKKQLIQATHDLASLGYELEDTITPQTDSLKKSLAKPSTSPDMPPPKTEPERLAAFNMVKDFIDKQLPKLNLDNTKLQKEHKVLVNRLDEITTFGNATMDYAGAEKLSHDINKFNLSPEIQHYRDFIDTLNQSLELIREKVSSAVGRKLAKDDHLTEREVPTQGQERPLAPHK